MKIGILKIGQIDPQVVERIQENLRMIFPKTTFTLTTETFAMPEDTFDKARNQYRSDLILAKIRDYCQREKSLDRILGIIDADIFTQQLNFVFGEAMYPGKVALISLWRLRPEFDGKPPKPELFIERATKEAVHELGHTMGLAHCSNPFCVMYFSNSIFDTDRKQSLFCSKCDLKIEAATDETG